MGKLHFAQDGHPYLREGYPVLAHDGSEDARFATYQLHPRAEELLVAICRFEENEQIPPSIFYALLLERDLYNDARPEGVRFEQVPKRYRSYASMNDWAEQHCKGAKYLVDIAKALTANMVEPYRSNRNDIREMAELAACVAIRRYERRGWPGA